MILGTLLILTVLCNLAVLVLATRNAARRDRAIAASPNVLPFRARRGSVVDLEV